MTRKHHTLIQHTASINGFADKIYDQLPACAQPCVKISTSSTSCPYWDTSCLCVIPVFTGAVGRCIAENCSGKDVTDAESLAQSICSSAGIWEPYWILPGIVVNELSEAANRHVSTSTTSTAPESSVAAINTLAPETTAEQTTAKQITEQSVASTSAPVKKSVAKQTTNESSVTKSTAAVTELPSTKLSSVESSSFAAKSDPESSSVSDVISEAATSITTTAQESSSVAIIAANTSVSKTTADQTFEESIASSSAAKQTAAGGTTSTESSAEQTAVKSFDVVVLSSVETSFAVNGKLESSSALNKSSETVTSIISTTQKSIAVGTNISDLKSTANQTTVKSSAIVELSSIESSSVESSSFSVNSKSELPSVSAELSEAVTSSTSIAQKSFAVSANNSDFESTVEQTIAQQTAGVFITSTYTPAGTSAVKAIATVESSSIESLSSAITLFNGANVPAIAMGSIIACLAALI